MASSPNCSQRGAPRPCDWACGARRLVLCCREPSSWKPPRSRAGAATGFSGLARTADNAYVVAPLLWLRHRSGLPMPLSNAERQRRFARSATRWQEKPAHAQRRPRSSRRRPREARRYHRPGSGGWRCSDCSRGSILKLDSALLKWLREWSPPGGQASNEGKTIEVLLRETPKAARIAE